jgi:hypothetical protein
MRTRIRWASSVAVVALAVASIVSWAPGAGAADGDAIIAGQANTQSHETKLYNTNYFSAADCFSSAGLASGGLLACARIAVTAQGTDYGLVGDASSTGIAGVSGSGPTGVLGVSGVGTGVTGDGMNGVEGTGTENGVLARGGTFGLFASGTDYGVYGSAPNHGVYGTATTNGGAGVEAQSNSASGIGLRVTGKAQFSRSGTATITGSSSTPKSSVVISNVALSAKSLVLATPQKNVAGVWVQGAVPNVSAKTITIFLNKTVTVSYPVAWFIVEKP